jgi:serine/threonine protein kinase
VALDNELNREVALKEILERHADDPMSRSRFQLEAEINGGLEHPGIVPVYGLGCHGDGRPYYVMRFIRGDTLKEAIQAYHQLDRKHDPGAREIALRQLLRRFLDVCFAVDYAHSRGVLHRDLKPSNVMVGKYGETLVVDWGLAKVVGRPDFAGAEGERTLAPNASGAGSETLPGATLGTPSFMSPEQAAGDLDRLGPTSDVYGLGATLYAILTGGAPFEGSDVGEILRRVRKGDFPAPRRAAPSVPMALESICLKAMATEPGDRYHSARALAEDIERWLADEPVLCRPEPIAARWGRWSRRHKTVLAGILSGLFVAMFSLFVGVVAIQRERSREFGRGLFEKDLQLAESSLTDLEQRIDRVLGPGQVPPTTPAPTDDPALAALAEMRSVIAKFRAKIGIRRELFAKYQNASFAPGLGGYIDGRSDAPPGLVGD